jgi:hypothetical protein
MSLDRSKELLVFNISDIVEGDNVIDPSDVIAVKMSNDFIAVAGYLHVDVDYRLQNFGADFNMYANSVQHMTCSPKGNTAVLCCIINEVFGDRTGVSKVKVEPFCMTLTVSKACTAESVMRRIEAGIVKAGYDVNRLAD